MVLVGGGKALVRSGPIDRKAVTPHVGRACRQGLLGDDGRDGVEVVANEERLAGIGEAVELVRLVVFAGGAALEMGDERGAIGGQILEVIHAAEANPGAAAIPPAPGTGLGPGCRW